MLPCISCSNSSTHSLSDLIYHPTHPNSLSPWLRVPQSRTSFQPKLIHPCRQHLAKLAKKERKDVGTDASAPAAGGTANDTTDGASSAAPKKAARAPRGNKAAGASEKRKRATKGKAKLPPADDSDAETGVTGEADVDSPTSPAPARKKTKAAILKAEHVPPTGEYQGRATELTCHPGTVRVMEASKSSSHQHALEAAVGSNRAMIRPSITSCPRTVADI